MPQANNALKLTSLTSQDGFGSQLNAAPDVINESRNRRPRSPRCPTLGGSGGHRVRGRLTAIARRCPHPATRHDVYRRALSSNRPARRQRRRRDVCGISVRSPHLGARWCLGDSLSPSSRRSAPWGPTEVTQPDEAVFIWSEGLQLARAYALTAVVGFCWSSSRGVSALRRGSTTPHSCNVETLSNNCR